MTWWQIWCCKLATSRLHFLFITKQRKYDFKLLSSWILIQTVCVTWSRNLKPKYTERHGWQNRIYKRKQWSGLSLARDNLYLFNQLLQWHMLNRRKRGIHSYKTLACKNPSVLSKTHAKLLLSEKCFPEPKNIQEFISSFFMVAHWGGMSTRFFFFSVLTV